MFFGNNLLNGFFLLLAIKVATLNASECTVENITTVNSCFEKFQQEIFEKYNISDLGHYYAEYNNKIKEWNGIEEICKVSESFHHQCLSSDLIENCINYNDFSFGKNVDENRFYVTNFLLIDFYCGNGYQVYKKYYGCLNKKAVTPPGWKNRPDNCQKREKFIDIQINSARNYCKFEEAVCFKRIYETLEACLTECDYCKNLNKKSAENLCNKSSAKYFFSVFKFFVLFFLFKIVLI